MRLLRTINDLALIKKGTSWASVHACECYPGIPNSGTVLAFLQNSVISGWW